jgi:hypothetical protein
MDNGSSSSVAAAISAFTLAYCIIILAAIAFTIFIFWRIFKKTGQNGAMSLITLIPGVGLLVVLCILAFGKWPIETEVEQHRMMHSGIPPTPVPPSYPGYAQPGQPQPPYTQYPSPPQYPPQQYY